MISLLSDPSMVGKDNMVLQMRDIDPKSPHPPDLELTTLWGWYMSGRSKQFKVGCAVYCQYNSVYLRLTVCHL